MSHLHPSGQHDFGQEKQAVQDNQVFDHRRGRISRLKSHHRLFTKSSSIIIPDGSSGLRVKSSGDLFVRYINQHRSPVRRVIERTACEQLPEQPPGSVGVGCLAQRKGSPSARVSPPSAHAVSDVGSRPVSRSSANSSRNVPAICASGRSAGIPNTDTPSRSVLKSKPIA